MPGVHTLVLAFCLKGINRPENIYIVPSGKCPLANIWWAVKCLSLRSGFRLPLHHKGLIDGVLLRPLSLRRVFLCLQRTSETLWSDHLVLGDLLGQALSFPVTGQVWLDCQVLVQSCRNTFISLVSVMYITSNGLNTLITK